jgi:hypothetical protein
MAHQPRDHWIERDAACNHQQMRLVHHHRAEATMEKIAGPAEPRVDGPGVAAVRFAKGPPQPIPVRRRLSPTRPLLKCLTLTGICWRFVTVGVDSATPVSPIAERIGQPASGPLTTRSTE